jgi:hypothetical protein
MALRETGVKLIASGLPGFLANMTMADKSVTKFQDRINRFRTTAFSRSGFDNLVPQSLINRIQTLGTLFGGIKRETDGLRSSVSGVNSVWNILNTQVDKAGYAGSNMIGVWKGVNSQVAASTGILNANKTVWSALDTQMQNNIQNAHQLGSVWKELGQAAEGLTSRFNLLKLGAAGLVSTFLLLGARGAAMPGIIEAFDVMSRYAGITANTLRTDLHEASRGTISDLALMQTANLALAGTEPEVAKALGQGGLAGLLEIARAQARATGQSVNYLYESLVLGVKRTSPRLVDNTGLVIGQTAAYEWFAQSVGKAADELTDTEKQIAILNFTLEKGKVAVETYGKSALTAAERLSRIHVMFQNTMDRLAVAVQPLYTAILAIGETLTTVLLAPLEAIVPVVYELSKAIGGPLMAAWDRLSSVMSDTFAPVARLVHRWILFLIGVIRGFGIAWDWLLRQVTNILGSFGAVLKKYLLEPLSKALDTAIMFKGAGYAFGSLGYGILWAFNNIIAPAVITIAKFIADFLMGESPPPKGPLSRIDKGGASTMLAWLEGFLGVSLTPVEEMAANVNEMLGDIGKLTHEQVEARLSKLDELLEPFIANLEIARAKMEQITEPLRAVQDILERKLDRALGKFFKGEITAQAVREIDKQMEGIEERISMAQEITDEAEIQLALAKSQQALQRALLEIQLRRTQAAEKEKEAKEKKPGGGTEEDLGDLGGDITLPTLGDDVLGDFLGIDDDEISSLFKELGDAFQEGVDMTGFEEQLGIAEGKFGELKDTFSKLGLDSKLFDPIKNAFDSVFGSGPNSIPTKFNEFKDTFSEAWEGFKSNFDNFDPKILESVGIALGILVAPTIISGLYALATASVVSGVGLTFLAGKALLTGVLALGGALFQLALASGPLVLLSLVIYGLQTDFGGFRTALEQTRKGIAEGDWKKAADGLLDTLTSIPKGLAEATLELLGWEGDIQKNLDAWPGIFDNLTTIVQALPGVVNDALGGIPGQLWELLVGGFTDAVTGIMNLILGGGGRDSGVDVSLKTLLLDIPLGVIEWLLGLPDALKEALVLVFQGKIDEVINKIFKLDDPNSLIGKLMSFPAAVVNALSNLGTKLREALEEPFKQVVEKITGWLDGIIATLKTLTGGEGQSGLIDDIINKELNDLRDQQEPVAGAKGVRLQAGQLSIVGEKGWEFFRPNVGGQVIPHAKSMNILDRLTSGFTAARTRFVPQAQSQYIIQQPSSTVSRSTSYDQRRTTNTFNVQGSQSMRLALAQARAFS